MSNQTTPQDWSEFDKQLNKTTNAMRENIRTGKRSVGWRKSKRAQRKQEEVINQEPVSPAQ